MSVADVIDPFVFMEINERLSYQDAAKLSTQQRAQLLAENPVAATKVFYRRVDSLFSNFLFGKTKPFQEIEAYLGRVEQQERRSPHLHLLLWLSSKAPVRTGNDTEDGNAIANFIELFCNAVIPPDRLIPCESLQSPSQMFPVPVVRKPRVENDWVLKMRGLERHCVLSKPCDVLAFSGSMESRRLLGLQTLASQLHNCSSYCRPRGEPCRFMFPFEPQRRGSIARRWRKPGDLRGVALCPRTNPFLNSTHPLLTAMFRANTDVTVITGNSVSECAYVCSYAMKSEKYSLFDSKSLKRLRNLRESADDDRKLLAAIARGAESIRIIGGQEASDNLLGNPLVFLSAKVLNIRISFLLDTEGALSEEQLSERNKDQRRNSVPRNILGDLDPDDNVAVPQIEQHRILNPGHPDSIKSVDPFLQIYMLRPLCLERMTASEFYESYKVRNVGRRECLKTQNMLLLGQEGSAIAMKIVIPRTKSTSRLQTTHILNVPTRGKADDNNPSFAAAALVLHTSFRSPYDILSGETLTVRLKHILQKPQLYPKVISYVRRSYEMNGISYGDDESRGMINEFERCNEEVIEEDEANRLKDSEVLAGCSVWDIEDNEDVVNPLKGLPPLFQKTGEENPSLITKNWNGKSVLCSDVKVEVVKFLNYLSNCKSFGVHNANKKVIANGENGEGFETDQDLEFEPRAVEEPDICSILELKEKIYQTCRNEEQRMWLKSVFSYLQFYYHCGTQLKNAVINSRNHRNLKEICRENPIILTNAPGGCGKSWLIEKLKLFVSKAIPSRSHPILDEEGNEKGCNCGIRDETFQNSAGRLGRIAVFAPSGVAADNAGGFTFHDGLRTYPISASTCAEDIPLKRISQLGIDFSQVICIVIDEFSMCSLCLLQYLDKVLRMLRPGFAHRKFGGIPVIMTGDAFQLPVVRSCGLLSSLERVLPYLRPVFKHCKEHAFFLELSKSVRQENDSRFGSALSRIRLAKATDDDVNLLNSRFFSDLSILAKESSEWVFAPILTSTNLSAEALNDVSVARNGKKIGTTHVFSVPLLSRAVRTEVRQKKTETFFKSAMNRTKRRMLSFAKGASGHLHSLFYTLGFH